MSSAVGNCIIPGDTRWNGEFDSCNDCVKKIDNSSDQLESLMTFLKLKKFTDVEIRGLREYVKVMEPIALALDFIQGDQVHLGHLLPLIVKTGNNMKIIMEENLSYCGPLAECIYKSLETRFHHLFDNRNHILASISNPAFKTRFLNCKHIRIL